MHLQLAQHAGSHTYGGSVQLRLRERTPPPQVLEQEPNLDQELQPPSWLYSCSDVFQMQWPLKHHWKRGERGVAQVYKQNL